VGPSTLLMDEPFGALDAMTKGALQDQLQGVQQRTGATVVFVTHDIDESVYLADRIVVLARRPTSVKEVVEVNLPRPRDQVSTRELPEFVRLRGHVFRLIRGEHAQEVPVEVETA